MLYFISSKTELRKARIDLFIASILKLLYIKNVSEVEHEDYTGDNIDSQSDVSLHLTEEEEHLPNYNSL